MNKRYSLSVFDIGLILTALSVLAMINIGQLVRGPALAEDVSAGKARMTGKMRRAYEDWDARNKEVSAFARGASAFGWVEGYFDPEVAKTDALAYCAQHGDDCELIELRASLSEAEGVRIPVSAALAPILEQVQQRKRPVALAVSGTGAYGIGQGQSLTGAISNARALCTVETKKNRKPFLPEHACTVIFAR